MIFLAAAILDERWPFAVAFGVLAVFAALSARTTRSSDHTGWWVSAVLATLAVERWFGFAASFADRFRRFVGRAGWYDDRRLAQAILLVVVIGVVAVGAVMLARRGATPSPPLLLALAAALLRAVRVISLHQVDVVLQYRLGGVRVIAVLDLVLVALVALSLVAQRREADLGGFDDRGRIVTK